MVQFPSFACCCPVSQQYLLKRLLLLYIIFFMFYLLFFWEREREKERERENTSGWGSERGGNIGSRLGSAMTGWQQWTQCRAWTEIMTWAKVRHLTDWTTQVLFPVHILAFFVDHIIVSLLLGFLFSSIDLCELVLYYLDY